MKPVKLKDILKGVEVLELHAPAEMELCDISYDSRKVSHGHLFVAVVGFASDGHRFISMAREKGAAAVLCQRPPEEDIPYILVKDSRLALAQVSANFFCHPAEEMTFVGITGTNGKTTTTMLTKYLLEQTLGAKVGLVGTIHNMIGEEIIETERTTPESYELQKLFRRMADGGCTHVVMEVSSHSLVLERVAGIRFQTAMFTNLTQDHLDFHKTMEEYFKAKAMLFSCCDRAVVNLDDPYGLRLAAMTECPTITYGINQKGDLTAENALLKADGVEFELRTSGGHREAVSMKIPGAFNVANGLGVLGIAHGLGIPLEKAVAALKTAPGVKGRVEVVPTPDTDYTVLIDYAHTPDGLENVLSSVRDYCKGRLIAVFGCGGDRDATKRPIMGEIGARLSDIPVITSDNPRTEKPAKIIDDILAGIGDQSRCVVVENRREAIRRAMDLAEKDDIIVLCGKGHETYQIIGTEKTHLDEREEVAAYLQQKKGR